tara:strand:- start:2525 stop:4543 length:2019 start_codon:yes stop_codon:yes gene_type:complete
MNAVVVGQFPHAVKEEGDARITLSDGTKLSVRIWRPVDSDTSPVPAIVEYLPYRKRDGTAVRDALNHPYFAGHGYACVRVDMRGSGDSDGLLEDEYLAQEQDDCIEVFEWLEAQAWCTGRVGMIGISWGGFNGLQLAFRQPPQLQAVVSIAATVDRYADDIHYKGGCLLGANFAWSAQMLSYMSRPPDPDVVGERWRELWLQRLEAQPHLAETWIAHQQRDDYWRHGSVCEDFASMKTPVMTVGGLGDGYMNAVPALLEHMEGPTQGLLGPWVHLYPNVATPGPSIGFLQECLRWWDRWLKDLPTGVEEEPALRAYMRTFDKPHPRIRERSGRWVAERHWPSPQVAMQPYYLRSDGLSEVAPATHSWLTHSSAQHTGKDGGEFFAWHGPDQPGDQRDDDALSLVFDMPVGEAPIEILGRPELALSLRVDRGQAGLAVRLNEVTPDGTSLRVAYGTLNLSQRHGANQAPELMPPDEAVNVTVRFDMTAHAFTPGNRIRVAISTAYWPLVWPAPQSVTVQIQAGASLLHLPVRTHKEEEDVQFEQPETAPPLALRELRPTNLARSNRHDLATGMRFQESNYDYGCFEDLEHGLIHGAVARDAYAIHPDDPLSARASHHWTQEYERGTWNARTETRSTMRADGQSFHLEASIEAYVNDELFFEKSFTREIPRKFV